MTRQEQVQNLAKIARISVSYAEDLFAKAWINGYEVEKEPRYTVQIKGVSRDHSYLNCNESRSIWFLSDVKGYSAINTHHTRKELEANGFGWVFDCQGVEVKEVE